ncbi:protein-L-isoaspartate O-methyltransferase, partial [Campylobacter jejuni]|nr:protein-L-isoaspartate O-methyltransferase [Campylobacter jejuni]
RIENLAKKAAQTFRELELFNINVKFDDGQNGWKNYAPYDRILFSAYATQIPEILLDQLSDDGILVAPILHNGKQFITRLRKNGTNLQKEILEECLFVPIVDGKE